MFGSRARLLPFFYLFALTLYEAARWIKLKPNRWIVSATRYTHLFDRR